MKETTMVAIGFVTKQKDGSYKGELKTLTIQTAVEIRPNLHKVNDRQPDFRIYLRSIKRTYEIDAFHALPGTVQSVLVTAISSQSLRFPLNFWTRTSTFRRLTPQIGRRHRPGPDNHRALIS
jgi:hypothetical protein